MRTKTGKREQKGWYAETFSALVLRSVNRRAALKFLFGIAVFTMSACNKDHHKCFDRKLQRQSEGTFCQMDCPGVMGCDGKIYCNSCVAAWEGISVVE